MRVVIVEDQLLFQEFLVQLIQDKLSHEIVGIADDGEKALEIIRKTNPDLILLDILIPKLSGIHVANIILEEKPATRILALSSETDIKTIHQVHQLRLAGFIDKNEASMEVLTNAIELIGQRKRYFSESLKLTVSKLKADPKAFQKILSPREQEVLTHIGGGLSDNEIGKMLGLSDTSVQSHRRNLFRKLDVHSTPELIRFAQDAGFWKAAFKRMDLTNTYHIYE